MILLCLLNFLLQPIEDCKSIDGLHSMGGLHNALTNLNSAWWIDERWLVFSEVDFMTKEVGWHNTQENEARIGMGIRHDF